MGGHFHRFFTNSNKAIVPEAGIEPALPKELDFESSASTSSATRASVSANINYLFGFY